MESKIQQEDIESSYRFFVSEALRMLSKNTTDGSERELFTVNFAQYLEMRNKPPETRTAKEIIENIGDKLNRLGGTDDELSSV